MKLTLLRSVSLLFTVAIIAASAAAAYAVFSESTSSSATDPDLPTKLGTVVPTSTPAVAPGSTIDRGLVRLEEAPQHRDARKLVRAVLRQDTESMLETFAWRSVPCAPDHPRARLAIRCSTLGLPPGSTMQVVAENLGQPVDRERAEMSGYLTRFLGGANPRLEVIAVREDGQLLVSFAVDSRSSEVDGSTVDSIRFIFAANGNGLVTLVEVGVPTHTVFDHIRDDEGIGPLKHRYEILGASDEALARESSKHRERAENPKARATP